MEYKDGFGTAAIGLSLLGLPYRMHNMINGDYGSYPISTSPTQPQQLEFAFANKQTATPKRDMEIYHL